jgi:hypothetical protein
MIPGYEYLMHKYWPTADLTILHWGDWSSPFNISKRCSLGPDTGLEKWSDALIPFFQDAPEYFAIMLEDYWLNHQVDRYAVKVLADHQEICKCAKMDLYKGVKSLPHTIESHLKGFGDLLELSQGERYRKSLNLNIWRKDYFLKLLRPGLSPWAFERDNPSVINDGELILGTDFCPVSYVNVLRRGKPDREAMKDLDASDVKYMIEKGVYVP